jgi:hypothetical protein
VHEIREDDGKWVACGGQRNWRLDKKGFILSSVLLKMLLCGRVVDVDVIQVFLWPSTIAHFLTPKSEAGELIRKNCKGEYVVSFVPSSFKLYSSHFFGRHFME